MNAKLFGLVSVTSLSGAVLLTAGGCSSTVTQPFDDLADAASNTSSSGGKKGSSSSSSSSSSSGDTSSSSSSSSGSTSSSSGSTSSSSGGKSSSSGGTSSSGGSSTSSSGFSSTSSSGGISTDAGPGPATSCVSTDPIDATQFPYTKALKSIGACTTAELTALDNYVKNLGGNDIVLADWQKTVSTKCSACVFTDDAATAWGPLETSGGQLSGINSGGCIELVSGSTACGKAYQQVDLCRLSACYDSPMCQTQADIDTCLQDQAGIFNGPCKTALQAVQTACGANLGTYEQKCQGTTYIFDGPVKVQCITGP